MSGADGENAVHAGFALAYGCRTDRLEHGLAERFVALDLDDETRGFIDAELARRPGFAKRWLHRSLLTFFSDFDADGFAGMYAMFLLGEAQWRALLGDRERRRHLDVGAGSGHVTRRLRGLAAETVTTETSIAMVRRLRKAGFHCVRTDVSEGGVPGGPYDLVTCLNVLDRCARPLSLVRALASGLSGDGELVLATPLPLRPFYYEGPNTHAPLERLPDGGDSWEAGVNALVAEVLAPSGLEVRAFTRAPYISGGDAARALYVLDDVIAVCRRRERS